MKQPKKANLFAIIGPGLLVAATGIGAGDLATASFAGSILGTAVLWAAVVGAFLKFVVTEGLARWQLATGTTLLEGWVHRLPRFISIYFFIYLLLWISRHTSKWPVWLRFSLAGLCCGLLEQL